VLIPAGDCNWGTSSLVVPGGIYIKGAGKNATTLRRGASVDQTASLIRFECVQGSAPVALSDIQLIGWGTVGTDDMGVRLERYCTRDFRIFNVKASKFTFAAIDINGYDSNLPPRGVIYNNEIFNNYTSGRNNLGYGVAVYGNNTNGNLADVLGSQNAVYVENNVFSGNRHSIASNSAASYVFRYNTVTTSEMVKNWGQVDAHGTTTSWGYSKSTFSWEIYNNSFLSTTTNGTGRAIFLRGGDGVVFNNTFGANVNPDTTLTLELGCAGSYPVTDQTRSAYVWGNNINNVGVYNDGGDCTQYLKQSRDYYIGARAGYTPYTYPHPMRSL
jgi:hypothetical protein